ncbi:hypothetical protein PQD71_gp065 [Kosakonia phage Kc263]|uniref:Uncharacterized protein n=1 Tax=Kosakonia phage Kc263 TaxID=2863194 RepID=A0AAE8BFG4_9CAUD|nr:hypothetical protein PQD71_gp065 [Kosakonia phage Kc263]QYN79958.1 hypothetical protein [Kosakonia phage Kc263]
MDKIRKQTVAEVHPWDRIPIILKSISGFNSCLTVSVMSLIFIWSVHISVSKSLSDWPGVITFSLMIGGPMIIALNFVNAKSVIGTILAKANDSEGGAPTTIEIPSATAIVTEDSVAVEREIIGPTTVILRAIAGFTATHVICFCSLLFTWTIHNSMIIGYRLPGDMQLFMVVIGPIITSWSFVRANATLTAVIEGASAIDRIRNKLAGVISTNK